MIDKIKELEKEFKKKWELDISYQEEVDIPEHIWIFFRTSLISLLQSDIDRLEGIKCGEHSLPIGEMPISFVERYKLPTTIELEIFALHCGYGEGARNGYNGAIDSELSLKRQAIEELKK